MSRCFPFPPPGYEKKARTEDVDSLIKDKYKEKKHKKEKKDKKKEGKDKDKERSKDKDREKKERKEKHKDKDRDKEKKKSKDKKRTDENKIEGPLDGSSGGKQNESNLQAETFKDAKLMAIGQRIADEERGGRDQMVENLPASDASKNDAVAMLVDKYFDSLVQEREKVEDKDDHNKKVERQSIKPEGSICGNSSVPSFSGAEQKRTGSTVEPTEKDTERKMEGKEKKKDQGVNDKRKEKHKHRDGEKKNKEKKAEKEKVKEKVKVKDKVIEVPKNHISTLNIQIPQDSEKSRSMEDNPRKRKDCETNGFLHDNALHNKLARPNLSSHLLTVNGKKSEPCQLASPFASPMPRGMNNLRFDNKVLIANGLIKEQPSSVSSTSLSNPRVKARENGESSEKPPHPDAKYLSKILTVPKMDDLSDFDDQEWLFNSDSQVKKPKAVSSGVPQVWDRALRIDSADVCALPYVIPY